MMNLKKLGIFLCASLLTLTAAARKDAKAREVLDQTTAALKAGGGIRADFDGTMKGSLKMRGKQFYLKTSGVESWYDGTTQWSYMERADEVSVSSPTAEEVQAVNPYLLLSAYEKGYQYEYAGSSTYRGQKVHQVVLTPDVVKTVRRITVYVTTSYQPLYIKVENTQGKAAEVYVTSYAKGQNYTDATFRFDAKKYPDAEIVDMR